MDEALLEQQREAYGGADADDAHTAEPPAKRKRKEQKGEGRPVSGLTEVFRG